MVLSRAPLSMLLEGIDWRDPTSLSAQLQGRVAMSGRSRRKIPISFCAGSRSGVELTSFTLPRFED